MEVKLPFLAEGVEECTATYWHVSEGEMVAKEDDLVEMQTSKAIFNVPAPVGGVVTKIMIRAGDVAKVGDTLCIIE